MGLRIQTGQPEMCVGPRPLIGRASESIWLDVAVCAEQLSRLTIV